MLTEALNILLRVVVLVLLLAFTVFTVGLCVMVIGEALKERRITKELDRYRDISGEPADEGSEGKNRD